MIAYLQGILAAKSSEGIIIDVGGVGYFVQVSLKCLEVLPSVGESAQVYTYLQVKEDSLSLFGFTQTQEKEMFELLISVNGLGPKLALTILSTFEPIQLARLVVAQDSAGVSKAQGVGKKIAQRICMELKDSFASVSWQAAGAMFGASNSADGADLLGGNSTGVAVGGDVSGSIDAGVGALSAGDAVGMFGADGIGDLGTDGTKSAEFKEMQQALRSMGFKDAEITAALEGCPTDASVEDGIRYALMSFGKGVG